MVSGSPPPVSVAAVGRPSSLNSSLAHSLSAPEMGWDPGSGCGPFPLYRASMSFRVCEGGRSRISADRGVVLLGDTGRPPSVEMSGGGALSAAVGGVLLSSPFWWPAVGLILG